MTCSRLYPVLPQRMPAEEAEAIHAGLEEFLEYKKGQGFVNLPSASSLRDELSFPRSRSGELVHGELTGSIAREEIDVFEHEGVVAILDRYTHLDLGDHHVFSPESDALWSLLPGTDVGEIDDGSVPQDVKDRIYQRTTGYMNRMGALYNRYQRLIIIPVEFAGFPRNPAIDVAALRSFFFGPVGTETLSSYFAANSFFQYALLEGWIADWVGLPANPPANQLSGSGDLVKAALEGSNVDWSRFIAGDGTVTQDSATVVIIPPFGGSGATRDHDVTFSWNNQTIRYQGQICFFDCKAASDPFFASNPLGYNVGVAVHELGHTLFGLPDRYGTGAEHYGHDYVGAYDIMSNDSSKKLYNAHDRMKIGWIEPRIIHLGHNPRRLYKLKASESDTNGIVIVYSDLSPDEYWVIENRSKDADIWGADPGFPESGLCVWWVNAVDDVIILINQHHAGERPLAQPQPELPVGPLFNGAVSEAFLFSQWEMGAMLMRKISPAGRHMSFEV